MGEGAVMAEKILKNAVFCQEVSVKDTYGNDIQLAVYQDECTNGVFAIDSSFVEQVEPETIPSPFMDNVELKLVGD